MSLRPQIYGFCLGKLRSVFGCGDEHIVARIEAGFERLTARDPSSYDERFRHDFFRAALRQAVERGVPFPELDAEREPHVLLAMLLAGCNQELIEIDSGGWSHMSFNDASESGELFLPDEADMVEDADFFRDLGFAEFGDSDRPVVSNEPRGTGFSYIQFGRPLFGQKFDTAWSYYGYLSNEEVRYLRSRLLSLDDKEEIGCEEALELAADLTRWCDELLDAKKDLWCFWS
jgi:hypothetical protein